MAYSWDDMIEEFRKLGGTADNIVQRAGTRGRGIFPIDNAKPIRLRVPANLLVPVEDIEFVDDRLTIRETSTVGAAERDFVERYENAFSWGADGRSDCVTFVDGMKSLELEASTRSLVNPLVSWVRAHAKSKDTVEQRFLDSRVIRRDDKSVLMPLMELVNHDPLAPPYDVNDDVAIGGLFPEEVLVRYTIQDAFGMFMNYGFASPEPNAFSLSMNHPASAKPDAGRRIVIKRDMSFKAKLGSWDVPEFKIEDGNLTLSCLMLGATRAPKLPRSIFSTLLKDAGWQSWAEEFDRICHANRLAILEMLGSIEAREGEFAVTVRKALRFQLIALSSYFGIRPL